MKVCISVDMDNYRDYQSLVDPDGRGSERSFYAAVPAFLDVLDAVGARATFFAIGRDAEVAAHRSALRQIAERGHEVGNHSWSHPYSFHDLSRAEKEREIARGEQAIADALGERPLGFRTPSADVDLETLELLRERGYLYDSSVIPSPLMMWSFMLYGKLFVRRKDYSLGRLRSVFAPPRPYLPSRRQLHRPASGAPAEGELVEIPISALPLARIPFYNTLFRIFPPGVFDAAVRLHGSRRPMLHMLFHLIDLVDLEGTPLDAAIARTPGLGVPFGRRRAFVAHAFRQMTAQGEAITLREMARLHRERLRLAA